MKIDTHCYKLGNMLDKNLFEGEKKCNNFQPLIGFDAMLMCVMSQECC